MKELFKSFYYPNENEIKEIWENENTLFIFDTNILLNLYRYKESTRNDFFELAKKIKDRIFLPHHVALEYQRNRLNTIASHRRNINKFINAIQKQICYEDLFFNEKQDQQAYSDIKSKYPEIKEIFESAICSIEFHKYKIINYLIKEINNKKQQFPHVNNHDSIRDKIDILSLSIGEPLSQEELDSIYAQGITRYKDKRSPGFKDNDKNEIFYHNNLRFEQKYGDLIIWEQIQSLIKTRKDIVNVVFISDDDSKKDWFESIDSEGKKVIGAKPDLQSEIYKNCNSIKKFVMHNSSNFLSIGNLIYELELQDESFEEIQKSTHETPFDFSGISAYTQNTNSLQFWHLILQSLNQDDFYKILLSLINEEIKCKKNDIKSMNEHVKTLASTQKINIKSYINEIQKTIEYLSYIRKELNTKMDDSYEEIPF